MKKKVLPLILALVMCLGLADPALALEIEEGKRRVSFQGLEPRTSRAIGQRRLSPALKMDPLLCPMKSCNFAYK